MTELTEILRQADPVTPEQAGRITASWQDLLSSPIKTVEERDEIAGSLSVIGEPASTPWVMARVAALLSQYYAADVPPSVVAIMAEDWKEELAPYPQWAVTKAVRWWKSEANTERKRRPLEGDISARAKHEMSIFRLGQMSVAKFDRYGPPTERHHVPDQRPALMPDELEASRKRIARLVADAGFSKRVFPNNSNQQG